MAEPIDKLIELLEGTTPGPWEPMKGSEEADEMRCAVVAVRGDRRYLVATIENGAPGDYCDTEFANARLTAAAPDLAAALSTLSAENAWLRAKVDECEALIGAALNPENVKA